MSEHDPVRDALGALPEVPLDPATAARVERLSRATLTRYASPLARLDDLTLGRAVPAVLLVCSLAYAAELVRFFARVF